MQHRKDVVRKADQHLSIDAPLGGDDGDGATLADTLPTPETPVDAYEEDWRQAILASAVEHVLTKTALSDRDRAVYRAYVQEGRPIAEVAAQFKLSRNSVSQIKTRIDKRIVAVGRELVAGMK